jgi:hypothetical protein
VPTASYRWLWIPIPATLKFFAIIYIDMYYVYNDRLAVLVVLIHHNYYRYILEVVEVEPHVYHSYTPFILGLWCRVRTYDILTPDQVLSQLS